MSDKESAVSSTQKKVEEQGAREYNEGRASQLLHGTEVDHVVEIAVLRDSSNSGSVVGACVNGRHSVVSSSETLVNSSGKLAIDGSSVQTLEEREVGCVKDFGTFEVVHLLNDDV